MEDLRKRLLNELFLAPSVVLPMVAGASAWLLSWGLNGVSTLNLIGLVGVLGSIGWFSTRTLFQLDSIKQKILQDEIDKKKRADEDKLDSLLQRLRIDKDYRTKDYLTLLRTCKADFEAIAAQPGIAIRSMEIAKQVRQLFWSAVDQLENSLKLFSLADRLAGQERNKVLAEREQVLAEIKDAVDHLQSAVKHYRDLMEQEQHTDLSALRDELDMSLKIAKRTEERMREFDSTPNYDSYLKQ